MKASVVKIALVFTEAGFFEQGRFEKMLQESGRSLGEILLSNISGQTIKDLFTYEIPLPFQRSKREKIQTELRRDLNISQSELKPLLRMFSERITTVAGILERGGFITAEAAERIREGAKRGMVEFVSTIVDENLLTVDNIADLINSKNDISLTNRRRQAGEILVYNRLVHEDVCQQILSGVENGNGTPAQLLEKIGEINQAQLERSIRSGLYLPQINLGATNLDYDRLRELPLDFLERHLILPFSRQEGMVSIAMSDPLDTPLTDALSLISGITFSIHYASQTDLIKTFNMIKGVEDTLVTPDGVDIGSVDTIDIEPPQPELVPIDDADAELLVDNVSTVQLVSTIIESAFATNATDIHIEPQQEIIRVRYRIDGRLKEIMQVPRGMHLPLVSRIKVLCDLNVTERRRPQDGHFSLDLGDEALDLRVSVMPTHLGEKVVIRVLSEANVVRGLADLGMEAPEEGRIAHLIKRPHGMLLVSGPTGSGKTTTLYACLNGLNVEESNIITIEDPVEYRIGGINQVQVDPKIDLTFAAGLRATLRQDPDIIMVGEIRDQETARIAVRSALTGHLVLSTLHANSSAGVVSALKHMDIPTYSIANSLIGVVSQRLVRRLCSECREEVAPKKAIKADLGLSPGTRKPLFQEKGCPKCLDTGFRGRIGLFEVWEVNPAMREIILSEGSEEVFTKAAVESGQNTLMLNAHSLLHGGQTSPAEVLRCVSLN